nr:reverse transcriptase domain-containing protein [Tanacetum cinerariifolium]
MLSCYELKVHFRGITRKNQGQDGDAKATLFNLEPTAKTFISNECLVEKESEVEVPVCKSIAIKKEDQGLHFMSCARKCNGQCLHSEHQSANQTSPTIVEPLRIELPFLEDQFQEDTPPESPMADNRTMAELLQAPTEGYKDAIFFPPSKTTNLRNEITRFQQRFDESFYEAWELFNDLLRACPHHGFSELHQLDTFYNALNVNDQDSLNSAAGGNFLDKMPREWLKIIKSMSKVCQSRAKAVVAKVGTSSSTTANSSNVAKLKDMVKALLLEKKNQSPAPTPSTTPAPGKAVELNYSIEDEEVSLVYGVLEGALGALGDDSMGDGVFVSSCVKSINNCFGGMMLIFGLFEALKVEALVDAMDVDNR